MQNSGNFLVDKIFSWVTCILHNHPLIISKKIFQALGKTESENELAAICTMGLLEPGAPETIYLNPRTSFEEQKHSLFHEGAHLLLSSLDEEFVGQKILKDMNELEKEIVAFEEYFWERFSREQKDFFGTLIKMRRRRDG